MTDDLTFEREARAWLEQGPKHAPTRVIADSLRTMAATPQVRTVRVPWRPRGRTVQARFALAAIIAVLLAGASLLVLNNLPSQVGSPSPSPTTAPSPNSSLTVSTALQATWASVGTRPWPGILDQPTTFDLGPSVLRIPQAHVDVDSDWSLTDNNTLVQVNFQATFAGLSPVLKSQRWNCQIGQIGVYSFTFPGGAEALTLAPVNDPCAPRAAILAGDWTRTPCQNGEWGYCPGPLAAGRHVAPVFKPFADGTQGNLTYTVPAGWADSYGPPLWAPAERPTQMSLWRESALGERAIVLYANVAPSSVVAVRDSPPIACGQALNANARTSAQVVDWLVSRPYLSVNTPTPVSIGGLTGIYVDVSIVPGWIDPCSFNTSIGEYDSTIPVFASNHEQSTVALDRSGNGRTRYILLDRGAGQSLLIVLETQDAADFESLIGDAMPVIDSFEFGH